MYTEISVAETTAKQFSTMQEAAEAVQEKALKKARKKLPAKYQAMSLDTVMQRGDFLAYFKYTLAQEIAQVFAAYDQQVQAVYLFDESTNPGSETEDYPAKVDLTIHLLLRVTSASAALESFITSLDRALTDVLRELPSAEFAQRLSFLDAIPVTQKDVESERGYAVLLKSIYAPPLMIWQRY